MPHNHKPMAKTPLLILGAVVVVSITLPFFRPWEFSAANLSKDYIFTAASWAVAVICAALMFAIVRRGKRAAPVTKRSGGQLHERIPTLEDYRASKGLPRDVTFNESKNRPQVMGKLPTRPQYAPYPETPHMKLE